MNSVHDAATLYSLILCEGKYGIFLMNELVSSNVIKFLYDKLKKNIVSAHLK